MKNLTQPEHLEFLMEALARTPPMPVVVTHKMRRIVKRLKLQGLIQTYGLWPVESCRRY